MPRTTDRNSKTLNSAAVEAMIGADQFDVKWSVRFADVAGDWTTSSGFAYYEIPESAIIGRSRHGTLDGGPWSFSLTLLASEIPLANVPKAYYRLEIDRIIGATPPNAWPYFTGVVDKVKASWVLIDGAQVLTYEIEAFGVSQRMKGYHVDFLEFLPASSDTEIYKAIGICREVRGSLVRGATGQDLPDAMVTYDLANKLVLDDTATFASPLVYTTNYTVDTSTLPAKINWVTGAGDSATIYYKYPQVQYFGIRRYRGGNLPSFFRTPYGRDHRDVFYTEVATGGWDSGTNTITPKDPIPYDSDKALINHWAASGSLLNGAINSSVTSVVVDAGTDFKLGDLILIDSEVMHVSAIATNTLTVTRGFDGTTAASHSDNATVKRGQFEYLSITDADNGTESVVEISSVSAAGAITLTGAPTFTPAAGDPIRLISTEIYAAWEEFGHRTFILSSATAAEGIDDSETGIDVSDGTQFAANNVIRIESEEMLVVSILTNTLTVTRGYNGTTAVAHAISTAIYKRRTNGDHQSQIRAWFYDYEITLTANATSGDLNLTVSNSASFANGDTILIGTEMMLINGAPPNSTTITVIRGHNESTATTHSSGDAVYEEFSHNCFTFHPNDGIIVPTGNHFTATNDVHITASPIVGAETAEAKSAKNRAEEALKALIAVNYRGITGLGIFANADIQTYATNNDYGPTGAYVKNLLRHQIDLGEWVQEFKNGAFPPNCYIRDERDGKISIRPYKMASTPSLQLSGIISIQNESAPEPYTAVVVMSEQEGGSINKAPNWFYDRDAKWTGNNTQLLVDRIVDASVAGNTAVQTDAGAPAHVTFKIPGVSPTQAFPFIESVKVYGKAGGIVTLRVVQSGVKTYYPPEASYLQLKGNSTPVEISGDVINRAAASVNPESDWYIGLEVYSDNRTSNPGIAAEISEVEIWVKQQFAWRAELSDDSTKLPAAYQPTSPTTQFGSIFVMTDAGSSVNAGTAEKNISRLWAPSALLKRIAPKYNSSADSMIHRIKKLILPGISIHDCRTLAEDYLLEETYKSTPYVITCLLDDRIEIGDTIGVPWPDGTVKLLFVEGISDSGGYLDNTMTITVTDRSTTNRVA